MNCQDTDGTCEPDYCRCDRVQRHQMAYDIVDLRLQELMEAVHAVQLWAEDLPTLSKMKALELYGAMLREQLLNK